jgi:hypothetical protein
MNKELDFDKNKEAQPKKSSWASLLNNERFSLII